MIKHEFCKLQLSDILFCQRIDEIKKNLIVDSILKNGFDYNLGHIVISKDNEIIDGNHRYHSLLEIYGSDFVIIFKKLNSTKKLYHTFLFVIVFPIYFLILTYIIQLVIFFKAI